MHARSRQHAGQGACLRTGLRQVTCETECSRMLPCMLNNQSYRSSLCRHVPHQQTIKNNTRQDTCSSPHPCPRSPQAPRAPARPAPVPPAPQWQMPPAGPPGAHSQGDSTHHCAAACAAGAPVLEGRDGVKRRVGVDRRRRGEQVMLCAGCRLHLGITTDCMCA
jgi:hypothetical protein